MISPPSLPLRLRYSLEQVLPHRDSIMLLDEIDDYGDEWARSIVRIKQHSTMSTGAGVTAWVGIEYMAQTAAVRSGIEQLQRGIMPPGIAFLLGTRRYSSTCSLFDVDVELHVSAKLLSRQDEELALFSCAIHHGQKCLAEADIKAYRPQHAGEFLGQ